MKVISLYLIFVRIIRYLQCLNHYISATPIVLILLNETRTKTQAPDTFLTVTALYVNP